MPAATHPPSLLARSWAWLRDVGLILEYCRFSVFVVLAGFAFLLLVPQGWELTVRLPDQGWVSILGFYLAVLLFAFEAWYWARFNLDAAYGSARRPRAGSHPRPARISGLINHLPRVIALTAHGVAVAACFVSGSGRSAAIGVGLLVQGAAFYYGLVRRRDFANWLSARFPGLGTGWLLPGPAAAGLTGAARLSRLAFIASLIIAPAMIAWAVIDPVGMGWRLGSATVVFIGFGLIVPVGSVLVYLARRGGTDVMPAEAEHPCPASPYPVVTPLVLCAILFGLWIDNHQVRTLPQAKHQALPMAQAVDRWLDQGAAQAEAPAKLVVVATAGGGIRAAYWTATVLGAVQDQVPGFRRQLFGISGVSGGSLGAAVFVTLLAQPGPPGTLADCLRLPLARGVGTVAPRGAYECYGQAVLSQDFLAPAIAGTLFSDLPQRFLPYGVLPDRAQALEEGWEDAWPRARFARDTWSEHGFDDLWSGPGHLPALLLNGTHVESGKRIITSHLAIDAQNFPDAHDFFALHPGSIRTSTAALNSARFPYVSPAGTIDGNGHIVDGGYFENFGATTARELLQAALQEVERRPHHPRLHPIVVLISNDPALDDNDLPATSGAAPRPPSAPPVPPPTNWLAEALSPIRALLDTRQAHGALAIYDLAQVIGGGAEFYHFRLCHDPNEHDPALGWVLSERSENQIRAQLWNDACPGNALQFATLVEHLKR